MAITVVTELAAEAGMFTAIAGRIARLGRGRAWVLWMLVVALATVSTVFLSLDTTAVLLTPVVVVMARHAGLDPIPFAIFAMLSAAPALVAIVVPSLIVFAVYRKRLLARFAAERIIPAPDRPLLFVSATVVAVLIPALVSGIEVWIPASVAALVLTVVFGWRRGIRSLYWSMVPW